MSPLDPHPLVATLVWLAFDRDHPYDPIEVRLTQTGWSPWDAAIASGLVTGAFLTVPPAGRRAELRLTAAGRGFLCRYRPAEGIFSDLT